jgi:hypothetical protein
MLLLADALFSTFKSFGATKEWFEDLNGNTKKRPVVVAETVLERQCLFGILLMNHSSLKKFKGIFQLECPFGRFEVGVPTRIILLFDHQTTKIIHIPQNLTKFEQFFLCELATSELNELSLLCTPLLIQPMRLWSFCIAPVRRHFTRKLFSSSNSLYSSDPGRCFFIASFSEPLRNPVAARFNVWFMQRILRWAASAVMLSGSDRKSSVAAPSHESALSAVK